MLTFKRRLPSALSIVLCISSPAVMGQAAQSQPDAGQINRETVPQTISPAAPSSQIDLPEQPLLDEQATGGQAVALELVHFEGNNVFDANALQDAIQLDTQKRYTLSELRGLANRISRFYRDRGYPFAQAYLPVQRLDEGVLTIAILEGQYGKVEAQGPLAEQVQPFLDSALATGDWIESDQLERTTLLIGDLPGVRVSPVMRPGDQTGEGNLDMQAEKAPRVDGSLRLDNHGNRYTGAYRALASVNANRLLTLGDELNVTALYTDEQLWFGSLSYERPIGYSGLRGFASFVRTDYELGTSEFKASDIGGTVDTSSLGVSYALRRSQMTNVAIKAQLQHKEITDENGAADFEAGKDIQALPLSVTFDHRDTLGNGGITYGAVTATVGKLDIRNAQELAVDRETAKTNGNFAKLHLDIARIQALPGNFSAFVRVVGQGAEGNLDSAEGLSLGGPNGVRGYPQGEASGDTGVLTQIELRYALQPAFTPYVFADRGRIYTNADTWDDTDNTRSLAGAGAGVRINASDWSADVAAAWRTHGGKPSSDTKDRKPNLWASLSYRF